MPEIILENVTKKFEKFVAVDNLSLHIADRGFVTLLGPSGCGKTTTLRMIAGLETPTSGRILIDGKPVFDSKKGVNVPPNKRDIGFLFQNYALWPHMTVYENIAFGLEMLKWDKAKIRGRVDELLALLKIEQFEKRYPSELSGGQQQRVAIARALALSPDVLCFDEPTSALDPELTGEVLKVIRGLAEKDTTMIIVTHEMAFAHDVSDDVIFMDGGVIVEQGPPSRVLENPTEERTRQFLRSYNK